MNPTLQADGFTHVTKPLTHWDTGTDTLCNWHTHLTTCFITYRLSDLYLNDMPSRDKLFIHIKNFWFF